MTKIDLLTNDDILIVDDSKVNTELLALLLTDAGYKIRCANSGELALRCIKTKLPVLVLLDVRLPDTDGFKICRILKADEKTLHIPIIFISVWDDGESKIKGFRAGGVDFIAKPFQAEDLLVRVETHVKLRQMQLHLENQNTQLRNELSELKLTEEAQIESEANFRNLFENSPIGISMTGLDGSLHVNKAFSAMVGYSEKELKTKKWMDITFPQATRRIVESTKPTVNSDLR